MNYKHSKLFIQGVISLKEHNYDKAYTIFNILYKNYPFDEIISLYYGLILFYLDNHRLALRVWEKLENHPKYDFILLKAFILIKQNKFPDAVNLLLQKLKIDKNNKIALKLLKSLKKSKNLKLYAKYLNFEKVFGKLPYSKIVSKNSILKKLNIKKHLPLFKKRYIIYFSIFIILALISLYFINTYFLKYNIFNLSKNKIDKINTNYLPIDKNQKVNIENSNNLDNKANNSDNNKNTTIEKNINDTYKNVIIYNSEKEIEKDFLQLKKAIIKKQYNISLMLINKIQNSNAKLLTKQKAELFREFLVEPSFDDNFYNPEFNEVIQTPFLYKGLFIKWKGIVNKIDKKNKSFEALVYEKSDIFIEGLAIGTVDGDLYLFKKQKIQFMGKIINIKNGKVYLKIKYIKNLF